MRTHPDFDELTERFFQDIDRLFSTREEILQFAIQPLSEEKRASLRPYLDEIIADRFGDKHLLDIWNNSKAQWLFYSASSLRLLLKEIRDRL